RPDRPRRLPARRLHRLPDARDGGRARRLLARALLQRLHADAEPRLLLAALDGALYRVGIWGLPLATSIVNIAGTAALLYLLRRRLGRIELGETARTV